MLEATSFIDNHKDTISSQLVDRLRDEIISGKMRPGTKINLARAKDQFDVSLSPLREALARLISDGLVDFQDNRGYWVAPVSLENLAEITQLRIELESYALRLAMAQADPAWAADLQHMSLRLDRPHSAEPNEAREKLHFDFHMMLVAGSKMPTLVGFCRQLLNLHDRYRRSFKLETNAKADHSEIVAAILARDAARACAVLEQHIASAAARLAAQLAKIGDLSASTF